ncbi:MAG: hypothetical protein ACI9UA_003841 [Pseudoalteromonas tetraodonis]|jgi:hypothetical protein
MIDAEQVQDRRMQVVYANAILDGLISELVARAILHAAFDAAASHPHREDMRVVIPALAVLRIGGATELTAPHDEHLVEHPTSLQVGEQSADRLIDTFGCDAVVRTDVVVAVPWHVGQSANAAVRSRIQLHETHTAFDQPPREDESIDVGLNPIPLLRLRWHDRPEWLE